MSKTLYVTDLDGTLLGNDAKLSEYSMSILNDLIKKGMLVSYATARSILTAAKVTAGLQMSCPLIVYNGAFIVDGNTGEILNSNFFTGSDLHDLQILLQKQAISPVVYALLDGVEKFSFHRHRITKGIEFYLNSRKNDIRQRPVADDDELYLGECFYLSCMDEFEKLKPIYTALKDDSRFQCIFQKETYSQEYWCEILPANATKAKGVLQLKALLGCDRVVTFGDALNDLSMFQISDECYAVANAHPDLKAIASGVIGYNIEDSVANFLVSQLRIESTSKQ